MRGVERSRHLPATDGSHQEEFFLLVNPKTSPRYIFISELSKGKKKKNLRHDPLFFWPRSLLGLCSERAQKIHFMLGADPEPKNSWVVPPALLDLEIYPIKAGRGG